MKKLCQFIVLLSCLFLGFTVGSFAAPPAQLQPDWAEHAVTIVIVLCGTIAALVSIVVALARNTFKQLIEAIHKLDKTIGDRIFPKIDDHEHRLSELEGAHKTRTEMRGG